MPSPPAPPIRQSLMHAGRRGRNTFLSLYFHTVTFQNPPVFFFRGAPLWAHVRVTVQRRSP